jgi:hypothetical protein
MNITRHIIAVVAIAIDGMINSPLSIVEGLNTTLFIVIVLNSSLLITKPDELKPAILRTNKVLYIEFMATRIRAL